MELEEQMKLSELIIVIVASTFMIIPLSTFYIDINYNYNPSNLELNTSYSSLFTNYVNNSETILGSGKTTSGFLTGDLFTSIVPTIVDMITGKYLQTYMLFLDDLFGSQTFVNIPIWVYSFITVVLILVGIFALVQVMFGGII